MIEIKVLRTEEDIFGYEVKGHAEFGRESEDIVCAAISVLAQTGIFSLKDLLLIEAKKEIDKGLLHCSLPDTIRKEKKKSAQLIINTVLVGMYETARAHPDRIKIIDERGSYNC